MIEHVYRRAAEARGIGGVVVATDDDRIARAVERFGGVVRMTQPTHRTGTDRIAEVARDLRCDIVVNVQGDLPLLEPGLLEAVVAPLTADQSLPMATLRAAIDDPAELTNPNVVKVVVDARGDALYFSRSPIPYVRPEDRTRFPARAIGPGSPFWKHIGLYAYRRDFLLAFGSLPQTPLERAESLEQLRALEHGYRVSTVETRHRSIEVDTPEDLERVRALLGASARA